MIKISNQLKALLESRDCEIVPVVEIYSRNTVDISSISAPANAIARFSNKCFTWENSSGSYEYLAKVTEFPSVKTYLDNQQNEAEIVIANVERGENSGSSFVLNNKIKGTWMVIRLIFPDLPDESWTFWWGKSLRPGTINNKTVNLSATQEIGNYKIQIPFRTYSAKCPLTPGKGECLGPIPLSEHSALYQQRYKEWGTMLCPDRTFTTCVKLENDKLFQGQRLVAVSGQFSYVSQDETTSNDQKKNKKKNVPDLKTESWSSLNQSDSNEIIALTFGRSQLAGHPFTWADTGTEVKTLFGFCEGRISDFDFIRCRNPEFTITSVREHYGEYGGMGSQTPDSLFNGFSGYNSKLAYLEVITTGSKPENVDNAPLVTAVIRGTQIPVPDVSGEYRLLETSDDPVHILRFLLTDEKFGKVPTYRMADERNLLTSNYCNELIEDRTQCESIVLPINESADYNVGYRRYRSTGVYTAYRDTFDNDPDLVNPDDFIDPNFEQPWVRWYHPFEQQPLLQEQNVLRRRFTANGALQEKTSLLDFIQKRILPCFRGWLNYNRDGKIEIRTKEPADSAHLRADVSKNSTLLPITNITKWRENRDGHLIIGIGKETAEKRDVIRILNSPACNNLPISGEVNGTIDINISPISGGSDVSPGVGYIDITGEVTANSTITLKFNTVPNLFSISYTTDGIENINSVTRMLTAHLNANPDFANYLTAYIIPSYLNRIYIRCEAGYLELDEPLEYDHFLAEQVMRVQAVFENCNDLFADNSATLDNIVIDSFSWNETNQDNDINAYTATYTSAVDDFHLAKIIPRTSWDTIEQEAELNEEELDLKFVDNYWQAAYITKSHAIENIDGNLPFTWRTGLSGFMLEMGDVVAVRHDTGEGALKYTPVWIKSISYDLDTFTTSITGMLYLSAAWDHRVQPVEPILTATLNPDYPPFAPEALGSSGGISIASESRPLPYPDYPWLGKDPRYSPDGIDRQ